jgi:hypothetical protein
VERPANGGVDLFDTFDPATTDPRRLVQFGGAGRDAHCTIGSYLEDCRVRSQNQYDTKMQVLGTMALAPMTRVAASGRLKQNLDTALRQCRSQYEFRLKTIDAQ